MNVICITKNAYTSELLARVLTAQNIHHQCFTDSGAAMQVIVLKQHTHLIMESDVHPVDCLTICKVNAALFEGKARTVIISSNRERKFLVNCISAGAAQIFMTDNFKLSALLDFLPQFEEDETPRPITTVELGIEISPEEAIPPPTVPSPPPHHTPALPEVPEPNTGTEQIQAAPPAPEEDLPHSSSEEDLNDLSDQGAEMRALLNATHFKGVLNTSHCPIPKIHPEDPYVSFQHFDEVFGSIQSITEQVVQYAKSPDAHLRDLAKLINKDPYLSAMVLKQANISKQGSARVDSLGEACVILGFATIERIALSSAIIKLFSDPVCETPVSFIKRQIAKSAMISSVAEHVCALLKLGQRAIGRVCQAALMTEVGRIALYESQPVHYADLIDYVEASGACPDQVEVKTIGKNYKYYSMLIAKRWGLAPDTCNLIISGKYRYEASQQPSQKEKYALDLSRDIVTGMMPIGLTSARFRDHGVDLAKAGISAESLSAIYERLPEIATMVWSCLFNESRPPDWATGSGQPSNSQLIFAGPNQGVNLFHKFVEAWNSNAQPRAAFQHSLLDLRYSPPSLVQKIISQHTSKSRGGTIMISRHGTQFDDALKDTRRHNHIQVVQESLSWRGIQLAIQQIERESDPHKLAQPA